jgi:hypothetical protein
MSGPKYGTIQFEARRLQALARQFEKKLEETLCVQLKSQITAKQEHFALAVKEFNELECEQVITASETLISGSESLAMLKEQYSRARQIASFVANVKGKSNILQSELSTLQERTKVLQNLIKLLSATKQSLLSEYSKEVTNTKERDFKTASWQQKNVTSVRKNSKLMAVYAEIIDIASSQDNFDKIQNLLEPIVNNHNVDESYRVDILTKRLQALKIELLANRDAKQVQVMQAKCKALYAMLGGEALALPSSIEALEQLAKELEGKARKREESKYIATAMHDVMCDVGYSVISSETLHRPKNETERRLFDFSDNSVLSVSTSDSGSIMFEVMGRKKGEALTAVQRTAIRDDMGKFCPDYDVIKKKLREKGIELSNERLCMPDEKYVREIDVHEIHTEQTRRASKMGRREERCQDG